MGNQKWTIQGSWTKKNKAKPQHDCCVFPRIVYLMLPVSLDCPLLIAASVFFSVYPGKLDKEKQSQTATRYVLDTTIHTQTEIK
jgi:hypothetical protein